jgi:thymidylate synthase ThyX
MLLALYSRDPRSARVHLEKIKKVGWQNFMSQYYVGYGHKSIGDCGATTICAENVSMLVAKAIQHNRMYNGQEASTRYLDMVNQPVLNPLGRGVGEVIQAEWMSFYSKTLAELVPYLMEQYPILPNDDPKDYTKAIKAKAFDIARGFLPAGCTTFVGWFTNLRQAWDHLRDLQFHPLEETRQMAGKIHQELLAKYPSSFGFKIYPGQDEYQELCSGVTYEDFDLYSPFGYSHNLDLRRLRSSRLTQKILTERPQKTELPETFERFGQIIFEFYLDFGSFRDLQRHRSCVQVMPLLTTRHGFHSWYLDSLTPSLRAEALNLLRVQEDRIASINDPLIRQYYVAMGYNVACELVAGLPSVVYIAELRSTQAVHPTLRPIAQQMGQVLKELLPEIAIHCDMSPDEWTTVRGKHDIVKKE